MIIKLCALVLIICVTANAQVRVTNLDSGSTLQTGHGTSNVRLGVVDAKEEDWEALHECNKEMARRQSWKNQIIPLSVLKKKGYWNRYVGKMTSAIRQDMALKWRMNNYTSYMTADLIYTGPTQDPNFQECTDMCPTRLQRVGAVADSRYGICFIIGADRDQDLQFKQCRSVIAEHIEQSMDDVFAFVNRVACVPDSFIEKRVVAFCPNAPLRQCRDLVIRLPLSCSPKFAKCQLTREGLYRKNQRKQKNKKHTSFLSKFAKRA